MKIKTRNLSYREVMNLPRPVHKKPNKQNRLLARIGNIATRGELKKVGFSYNEVDMEKAGDGPWLILMNHSSFIDLVMAFEMLKGRRFNIVCTSDGLVGKEWAMRQIGCIPTSKFVTDITLVSDMDHALHHNNSSVLLYPEASYSFDGTATRLPRRMGVLFKRLKVPIVMITTYGAFARDPLYNNLQKRDVKVTAEMRCLFSQEELASTKIKDINQALDDAFSFDYFKWQEENKVEVTEDFRADGLHRILYKCPHCMSEGNTEGKGISFICHDCGAEYEMDTLGRLHAKNGLETIFSHIPDWYAWERQMVRKSLEDGTYSLDTECDIGLIVDFKALYMVGSGRLKHTREGFVLDGCEGELHYEQGPLACYSVYSDYYWYEIGDIVCIGTNDCLYYCFPKKKDIVARTRLAAEELYKMMKEKPDDKRKDTEEV
ncbi:MAG: 1-acyl-sn-glycerol-3-phosphate acyltransferase [Clostridiales bacterium]|nr:1-acyl-sn-glycerol-3-phosphate acyltransferase [Clostridiales bacterium]